MMALARAAPAEALSPPLETAAPLEAAALAEAPRAPLAPAALAEAPLASLVSVVVPCHNAEQWLQECLESVRAQTHRPLELSLWDDGSTDGSGAVVRASELALLEAGVQVTLGRGGAGAPLGCGAAKNRAVRQCSGSYLCFLDADDVMCPSRVEKQLELAQSLGPRHLVGCNVLREPRDAQPRHSAWLNGLGQAQLVSQRFCESTLAMPTWFCHREVFDRVGGFSEAGRGEPEDLAFFYAHLRAGGALAKVPEALVVYRYHEQMESFRVSADAIWALRVEHLQSTLLGSLDRFCIWSAGRDGKRLYRSLSAENRAKVVAFLDVDAGKLAAGQYYDRQHSERVPIVPWTRAAEGAYQPLVICVKRGLHAGFEDNLASLRLEEGAQYWHFN